MLTISSEWHSLLTEFCSAWRDHDPARLEALWDTDYPDLVYIAEERRDPIIGWEAIRAYYRDTLALMSWMKVKIKPIRLSTVGEVSWLIGKGSWAGQNRTRPHVSGGYSRVCFLAHRKNNDLRLIQYVEAPLNTRYVRPMRLEKRRNEESPFLDESIQHS